MSTFKLTKLLLLASLSLNAFAQVEGSKTNNGKALDKKVTQSSLSKADIVHAKQWKLSSKEYEKYKEILRSPRAYFTPNLEKNPLLALALESESEIERQRYADKWVQMQFENNIKVISWQLEVTEAWKRAFPGTPKFAYKNPETAHYAVSNMKNPKASTLNNDWSRLRGNELDITLTEKPRAQLYLSTDNCEKCIDAYKRQYKMLKSGKYSGLDIHFIANPTKKQIVQWATKRVSDSGLDASDVNEHRTVTLNVAEKEVEKVPFVEFN